MSIASRKSGFTLVEIIVSLAIFSVVAVIAVGALVRILGQNRQAQGLQSSINNLGFALESMSRELRVGHNYYCVTSDATSWVPPSTSPGVPITAGTLCPGSAVGTAIAFNSSNVMSTGLSSPNPTSCNLIYSYRFVWTGASTGWRIDKAEQKDCATAIVNGDFYPIVASSTVITGYELLVSKPTNDTSHYAQVFLRLAGYSGARAQDRKYFDVETAISERVLDQ